MNTLLIIGLGDIARRALPLLRARFGSIVALVRPGSELPQRAIDGLEIVVGDLDQPHSLAALPRHFTHVLHTAPPPVRGTEDPRTADLLAAIDARGQFPGCIVYISTSGVYGNCEGEIVDESRQVNPQSDRARRRVDAERQLVDFGRQHAIRIVTLRAPGIYAADRLPLQRLRNRTPVLRTEDDVYTNHIHADDLAAMCCSALTLANAQGIYNACDDSALPMGQWFDLLADRSGLPRPPRIARADARGVIPAPLLSFMSESRRLSNARIKRELNFVLRYPTVFDGVPQIIDTQTA